MATHHRGYKDYNITYYVMLNNLCTISYRITRNTRYSYVSTWHRSQL